MLINSLRYLGCNDSGTLSATAQAVSPLESFILTAVDIPEEFQLKTMTDTFIGVDDSRARCDLASANHLRLRMQARFKPRIQATTAHKARQNISRSELEEAAGRRLNEGEVRLLKRARREGDYHEQLLQIKVKNKHDKYG